MIDSGVGTTAMPKDKKLFIGICNSQDTVLSAFFWSFIRIRNRWDVQVCRGGHVWDVVRNNQLIDAFLKSDCDYFIKMDVDQAYPPDYFEVMVPLLETHDIIGPMIYDRHIQSNFMPLCFERDEGEPFAQRGKAFDGKTGIMELPYLHTNCFYNRYALEAIPMPWYEAHLSGDGLSRANHVDYTFMRKFVKKGFKIYINFDVVVVHMAQVGIDRDFYEHWNRQNQNIL